MNHPCVLCGEIVLGIQGNDIVIQPYITSSAEGVYLSHLVGNAHSACLNASPYGGFYCSAMRAYVKDTLMSPSIITCEAGFVARLHQNAEIVAVFDSTYSVRFALDQLHLGEGQHMRVRCRSTITVSCKVGSSALAELRRNLAGEGIRLSRLLEFVEIAHLPHKYVPDDSVLMPFVDDPELSFEALDDGVISGMLHHYVCMPDDVGAIVRGLSQHRPGN